MPDERPYSPGLQGVIGAETAIGHVDGEAGHLCYRGVPIEAVVARGTFADVAALLLHDARPAGPLLPLRPPAAVLAAIELLPADVHPMDGLRTAVSAYGAARRLSWPPTPEQAEELLRTAPFLLAAVARIGRGLADFDEQADLPTAFITAATGTVPDPGTAKAIEAYWMACAEHGLNASTFTARVITATRSDLASAVTGAIGALKGPLHGGAPAEVVGQIAEIGSVDRAAAWAHGKLDRKELIMGFGHRVYRAYDPRAAALRAVAESMPHPPEWIALAIGIEDEVLKVIAERKPSRPLRTNVEFYAAPVLAGTGLPPALFPALFALGRIAGWSAHAVEQAAIDKLIRPDARYTGPEGRDW
jgi:citrate synthase